jgi:chromate transporter
MYRDLVEKRGWITESDYKEGMAMVGLAFVLPSSLGAGVLVWFWRVPSAWLSRGHINGIAAPLAAVAAAGAIDWHKLGQIGAYFAYAGSFVFGSGLAIVPFLYSGVVKEYGWLTDRQFVDAVAVAMITPGPVVITTGFIGYLVSGFWGAAVAAIGTFLPCYLLTIIPAPYFKKHGKRPAIVAFVDGVTAAAIGAIAGAVMPTPRAWTWRRNRPGCTRSRPGCRATSATTTRC